jgi:MtN3 and saliva related transmembrane protein
MEFANTLGLMAGTLTTIAFIPQLVKTWKTRYTRDISLGMFMIFSIGTLLWLLYGVRIGAAPVVIANAVTLVLALTILVLKIKYK